MFVGEVLLGLATIYVPFMQKAFDTQPLALVSVLKPVLAFIAIVLIDEVRKLIGRTMEESSDEKTRGVDLEDDDESDDDEDEDEDESEDEDGTDGDETDVAKPDRPL